MFVSTKRWQECSAVFLRIPQNLETRQKSSYRKKKKNIYIYIVIHPYDGILHSSVKEQAAASLMNHRAHTERKKSEEAR